MRREGRLSPILSLLVSFALLLNTTGVYAMPIGGVDASFGFLGVEASKAGVSLVWQKGRDIPTYIERLAGSSFFVGLTVPKEDWWVNLDLFVSPEESLGKGLEFTPAGRILMESDVKLKHYAMKLLSESMADELGDSRENVSLRFWIEPQNVSVSADTDSLRFDRMRLQVKAEVVGNDEVERLVNAEIVPELTKLVNNSPDFKELRLVCKALIAAWWYKSSHRDGVFKNIINNSSVKLIDNAFWTRRGYIADYMGTFITSKAKGLDFISISTGGIRVIPDKIGVEKKRIDVTDREKSLPVKFVPVVPVFGDVDMDGVEVTGKSAVVSAYKGEVKLAELLGKDTRIGDEIVFIHPNGKVERIKRPEKGERGVLVKKDKAVVINSKGEVKVKDLSKDSNLISFGTSGWRFKVPVKLQGKEKEEAREKLLAKMKAALHGFADYYWDHINSLPDEYKDRKGVVIVRDSRYMGDEFLELAVQVLTSRGIPVYVAREEDASTVCPTPVAAFAIDRFKAAFAINFTASHNPAEDNGFKVTPYDGGAAEPEITDEIGMRINERLLGLRPIEESAMEKDLIKEFYMGDLLSYYATYVEKELIDVLGEEVYYELIRSIGEKDGITTIITSALHGSAGRVLKKLSYDLGFMSFGGNFIVEDKDPDPLFGGLKAPEPSKEMLERIGLIGRIKDLEGAAVAFVPDGDADRFAVIDSKGNYISPNQFMGVLDEFLNKYGRKKGGIVKTVPSSDFALAVARRWNQPGEEMKVGFKWAKQFWNRDDIAVVGEESAHIGLAGTKTWDDGLLMGILGVLMEVYYRKYEGKSLSDVVRELEKKVGYYRYKRVNVPLTADLKKSLKGLFDVLYSQKGGKIVARNDLDNLAGLDWNAIEKAYGNKIDKVVLLDGVKIVFEDNGWFAVRLSGTEPVARLYVEGVGKNEETAVRKRGILERVGKEFLDGKFLSVKKNGPSGEKLQSYESYEGLFFKDSKGVFNINPLVKDELLGLFDEVKEFGEYPIIKADDVKRVFSGIDWDSIEKEAGNKKITKVALKGGIKVIFDDNSFFSIKLGEETPVAWLYSFGVGQDETEVRRNKEKMEKIGKDFLQGRFFSGLSYVPSLGVASDRLNTINMYINKMQKFDSKEWKGLLDLINDLGYREVAHMLAIDLFMEGLIDRIPIEGPFVRLSDEDVLILDDIYAFMKNVITTKNLPEFVDKRLLDRIGSVDLVLSGKVKPVQRGEGLLWQDRSTSEIRLGVKLNGYVLLVGDPLDEEEVQDALNVVDGELKPVLGETIWNSSLIRSLGLTFEPDKVFGSFQKGLSKQELADLWILYVGKALRELNISIPVIDRLSFLASMRSPYLTSVVSDKLQSITKYSKEHNMHKKTERNVGGILLYRIAPF